MKTFLVIKYTQNWNSYLGHLFLLALKRKDRFIFGLAKFTSDFSQQWNELTAAVVNSQFPTLLFFIVFEDK